jgi:hypothetical protein
MTYYSFIHFCVCMYVYMSSHSFAVELTNPFAPFNAATVSLTNSSTISFPVCPALFTEPPTTPIGL